jgi:hypothetical protein
MDSDRSAARFTAGVRHYLVNAPHNDMAQHTTTYSLLRQLLPLATCSTDELKARLDQVTQRTFIAGARQGPSLRSFPVLGLGRCRLGLATSGT